jgi:hypothetical protein
MEPKDTISKTDTPLYVLAENRELGDLQLMDKETLDWIKVNSGYTQDVPRIPEVAFTENDIATLIEFLPADEEFLRHDHINALHGISHVSRTMVNMIAVCKRLGIEDYKPYLFMMRLHDLRRENDKGDTGHGLRAWEYFVANRNAYSYEFLNSAEYLEQLEVTVTYHETNYEDIPSEVLAKHQRVIDIVKAADALDRYRMPKARWFPNPEFMALQEAHALLPLAKRLTIESEELVLNGQDIRTAVINTAKKVYS